jgi:hypothetical protein
MIKWLLLSAGFFLVVLGITLVLRHWQEAVIVFNGIVPAAVAVAGLVVMFAATLKR